MNDWDDYRESVDRAAFPEPKKVYRLEFMTAPQAVIDSGTTREGQTYSREKVILDIRLWNPEFTAFTVMRETKVNPKLLKNFKDDKAIRPDKIFVVEAALSQMTVIFLITSVLPKPSRVDALDQTAQPQETGPPKPAADMQESRCQSGSESSVYVAPPGSSERGQPGAGGEPQVDDQLSAARIAQPPPAASCPHLKKTVITAEVAALTGREEGFWCQDCGVRVG